MAGQSPEPSFQPAGQDPGLTQGRPAWQTPPGYTPPGGSTSGSGGGQAYAQSSPQDQGYPAQDQTYTVIGQNQHQDYQGYQDYQQAYQGHGAQQGQGAGTPQWHGAVPGMKQPGRTKSPGEKGFVASLVGSLFDYSFNSLFLPKIIKVIYVLVTIGTALTALTILIYGFRLGGVAAGVFTLLIIDPIFILLTLAIWRVVLEVFIVVYRIYEETKKIRENGPSQG